MKSKKLIGFIMVMAMVLIFSEVSSAQQVFKWRAQAYTVAGGEAFKAYEIALKNLKEASGGRLDIRLYGVGTLVGGFEQLDGLSKGLFECAFNAPGFFVSKDPAFAPYMNPLGLFNDTHEVKVWLDQFGGKELAKELYAKFNVRWVGYAMVGAEPIMSKVPLRSLSDFRGLKIRTLGGLTSTLFTKLGASPVAVAGGEIYSALNSGIVDAAEWVTIADDWDIGLHEVSKYILYPSFHGTTAETDFSVNNDAWKKLPPDLQALLEAWTYQVDALHDYMTEGASFRALKRMLDKGLVHTQLSEADMQKTRQMSLEIVMEWKKKSPMSAKVIDSMVNYLTQKGVFK